MMQLLKNTKMIGGLVVVVGLLAVAYFYWGGGGSATPATVVQDSSPASQALLSTLSSLHAIKLDPSIFSDPLFTSLTDFGVTIPPQATGRPNPFAPAGTGGAAAPAPPSSAPATGGQ